MTISDWAKRLDAFLSFNERDLLTHAGKVQAKVAKELAEARYDQYDNARQTRAEIEADEADLAALRAIEKRLEEGKE